MVEGCLRVHAARRDGDGSRACEYPARRDEAEERADDNGGLSFFFFFSFVRFVSGGSEVVSLAACMSMEYAEKKALKPFAGEN